MKSDLNFKKLPRYFGKPTDCIFGRTIHRRFSRPFTLLFLKTSITPNQISLLGFLISLVAIGLIATGIPKNVFWGGILFYVSGIIGNCDGEVARLKKMSSPFGEKLDTGLDHVTLVLFFVGSFLCVLKQNSLPHIRFIGLEGLGIIILSIVVGRTLTSVYRRYAPPEIKKNYIGYKAYLRDKGCPAFFSLLFPFLQRGFFDLLFPIMAIFNKLNWLLLLLSFGAHLSLLASLFLIPFIIFYQAPRGKW